MGTTVPVVIIIIGVLLAGLAFFVWNKRKEFMEKIDGTKKKVFFAQFFAGIAVALLGAAFMFDGDILGENTSGIATVIGIVGIALIATSNVHLLPSRRK